jgi:excisionase family DNA binding protein
MPEVLYTLDEVAAMLKVSIKTVRRLIDDGKLKAIKIRGQLRIKQSDLDDYLSRQ